MVARKSESSWGISDKIWLVLIPSGATVLLAAITVVGQYLATTAATNAAEKAEAVRVELRDGNEKSDEKLDEIHTLVNSQYGIALTLNADNARFKANKTMLKEDEEAADMAEKLLREHRENQKRADAK